MTINLTFNEIFYYVFECNDVAYVITANNGWIMECCGKEDWEYIGEVPQLYLKRNEGWLKLNCIYTNGLIICVSWDMNSIFIFNITERISKEIYLEEGIVSKNSAIGCLICKDNELIVIPQLGNSIIAFDTTELKVSIHSQWYEAMMKDLMNQGLELEWIKVHSACYMNDAIFFIVRSDRKDLICELKYDGNGISLYRIHDVGAISNTLFEMSVFEKKIIIQSIISRKDNKLVLYDPQKQSIEDYMDIRNNVADRAMFFGFKGQLFMRLRNDNSYLVDINKKTIECIGDRKIYISYDICTRENNIMVSTWNQISDIQSNKEYQYPQLELLIDKVCMEEKTGDI